MRRERQLASVVALVAFGLLAASTATTGVTSAANPSDGRSAQASSVQCPIALPPDASAAQEVGVAVQAELLGGYPPTANVSEFQGFRVVAIGSLAQDTQPAGVQTFFDTPYHGIAAHACGTTVADRSWVVFVYFPKLSWSADMSQGIDYLARTDTGWHIWWRYH